LELAALGWVAHRDIWSGLAQMVAALVSGGAVGVALAVATLGYYYRRRGLCRVCGRGTLSQPTQQQVKIALVRMKGK